MPGWERACWGVLRLSSESDQFFDAITGQETKPTRVLMVSGATGGHIFPALAVAQELRARSEMGAFPCEIEFVGTRRPLEGKLIPAAGYPLRTVDAAGLKGIGGLRWFRNLLVLPRTLMEVRRILRDFQPQVVVGVGGYLAGPVLLLAALRRIPTLLIEPNVRPGFTNRVLRPMVTAAAVGFEATARFYGKKAKLTGHPIRMEFLSIPPQHHAPPGALAASGEGEALPFTLLVVGGSQGARAINQAVAAAAPGLAGGGHAAPAPGGMAAWRIIHQTGERDYHEIRETYQRLGIPAEVHAFIDDMPGALAPADLVISRAGATAVAELAAAGRASILIPFPGATDQHQLGNAREMEKAGAARVIVQPELTPERLTAEIQGLAANPAALEKMEAAARALARPNAAAQVADMVQGLAGRP